MHAWHSQRMLCQSSGLGAAAQRAPFLTFLTGTTTFLCFLTGTTTFLCFLTGTTTFLCSLATAAEQHAIA